MKFGNEKRFVYEALSRHNYFPNQKANIGEIPPIFSSRRFTPEIIEKIIAEGDIPDERGRMGYDLVEYSSTRYNNVPRTLGIPHPMAHSKLTKGIVDKWPEISRSTSNPRSKIKPDYHEDGRLMIMNYEGFREKVIEKCDMAFGKRFLVSTDISGCFNTVYTHAIEWAVLGFAESKERLKLGNKAPKVWPADLDTKQRQTRRGETQGITIGPATSNVILELILTKVDAQLSGFEFSRYIDDYICYCSSSDEADDFLQKLSIELRKYKLHLNLSKTQVQPLPAAIQSDWVSKLHAALPQPDAEEARYSADTAIHFIEYAINLNHQTPDGSVLKYAIQQIIYRIESSSVDIITDYLINLSWHYPSLLPFLDVAFPLYSGSIEIFQVRLNKIIEENARCGRSDGMCWPLYYIDKFKLSVDPETSQAVIKTVDCLSLCLLFKVTGWNESFDRLANEISQGTLYEKDQMWLFMYQAFINGHIENPYMSNTFHIMRAEDVDFMIVGEATSQAEQYSSYLLGNEIFDPEKIPMTYTEFTKEAHLNTLAVGSSNNGSEDK